MTTGGVAFMSRHRVKTPKSQGLKALAAASQVNFSVMDVWTPVPGSKAAFPSLGPVVGAVL